MNKPTTIKDIAERLQVSIATVSRALRGSTEIKKETKAAVLAMAKSMDYHPNLLASSLSSKKSKIIGVVVPTINRYFWSNSIAGIENLAYQEGYKVMIFQSGESFKKGGGNCGNPGQQQGRWHYHRLFERDLDF